MAIVVGVLWQKKARAQVVVEADLDLRLNTSARHDISADAAKHSTDPVEDSAPASEPCSLETGILIRSKQDQQKSCNQQTCYSHVPKTQAS